MMERMMTKSKVMAHKERRRRRRNEPQTNDAKEQKGLEEIQVVPAAPFLFGEGS